jgi:hypothetical protein
LRRPPGDRAHASTAQGRLGDATTAAAGGNHMKKLLAGALAVVMALAPVGAS